MDLKGWRKMFFLIESVREKLKKVQLQEVLNKAFKKRSGGFPQEWEYQHLTTKEGSGRGHFSKCSVKTEELPQWLKV